MIVLNFQNVEQLIFQDPEVQKILSPGNFNYFEQWRLGVRVPYLRDVGKRATLDFLMNLTDDDAGVLEGYFGEKIVVEKLNYNVVQNMTVPLDDVCDSLCGVTGMNYVTAWRDEDKLYLTLWR